jgi:predicted CoA-binding protein
MMIQLPDQQIKTLLDNAKTIAVVGLSPKQERPSNMVADYLIRSGYHVVPVNPGQREILGIHCYPDLASVPLKIDIVDIFRKPEDVPPIVQQAIEIGVKAVWIQQGIVHDDAAQRARDAGLIAIMDRCIKVDHAFLSRQ